MKIAYTFNGITGGLSGKNYDMKDQDNQKYLIKLVYKYIEENIIQHNDVDFFIFSWQKEQEDLVDSGQDTTDFGGNNKFLKKNLEMLKEPNYEDFKV